MKPFISHQSSFFLCQFWWLTMKHTKQICIKHEGVRHKPLVRGVGDLALEVPPYGHWRDQGSFPKSRPPFVDRCKEVGIKTRDSGGLGASTGILEYKGQSANPNFAYCHNYHLGSQLNSVSSWTINLERKLLCLTCSLLTLPKPHFYYFMIMLMIYFFDTVNEWNSESRVSLCNMEQ